MGKALVIVESPTKARTISKFLPRDFVVESSIGHIRDLPTSAREIPEKYKKEPWARLGIDVENEFEPLYVIPAGKKKQVAKLRALLKKADELYLATDEDREGESISWHLCEVLRPKIPRRRLVFHEITREAIQEALRQPRDIDSTLVEAQETRRIVDRLYGYEISPVLWRKIAPKLSAGRVQSVAVKIIVDREWQRRRFVSSEYWDLEATFETDPKAVFRAALVEFDGRRVASGKDFDEATGRLRGGLEGKVALLDAQEARALTEGLAETRWSVANVDSKPYTTKPAPPFTTSTLQQEANRKLRLSARATMRAAQRLYESGHITYMRTDSVTLSDQAISRSREVVEELYGGEYLPGTPRRYKTRVKNAQEAHEAIRPSAEFRRPEELRGTVEDIELKLYELIWKRTVACQMADARGKRITVRAHGAMEAEGGGRAREAVFQASGKTIEFPGFLRAYVEGADDPEAELADKETLLPDVRVGDSLSAVDLSAREHSTQPPARYTEASLIKELEANGVGRPSTYATIIDTIQRREYVVKQGNALVPTFTAFAVVQLLERFFERLIDVQFTARMENDLDAISLGEKSALPYLRDFYFGNGESAGLKDLIGREIDARESCTIFLGRDSEGRTINVRVGRYGPFLERGDDRASIPEGLAPDALTEEKAEELLRQGSGPQQLGTDPHSGKPVYLKSGRYGPYVQLGDPDGESRKRPKMKSLLPGMEPQDVGLETALRLLSLPRSLGVDPKTDEEVFADFGRYGPYVKRGRESRSLSEDDDVFVVSLDRALELLSQEKAAGGWKARSQPKVLRELGAHTDTGVPVRLMTGRYGPYVTDGELNASLPRGASPESCDLQQAIELLRGKALSGPARRKKTAKRPAKKTRSKTTKKAPAKRTSSKKAPAKKSSRKKTTRPAGKKTSTRRTSNRSNA